MSAQVNKHPIDDISIADGFIIHDVTGESIENIRYILRYPRMHMLSTLLRVLTPWEITQAITSGVIGEVDEGEEGELEAQESANDVVQVLRDANYQLSRVSEDKLEPEKIRDYALERVAAEIEATNASAYSKVVACLGWVWVRKAEPSLTFEEYTERHSEKEVIAYLDDLMAAWAKDQSESKEGEIPPLDLTEGKQ